MMKNRLLASILSIIMGLGGVPSAVVGDDPDQQQDPQPIEIIANTEDVVEALDPLSVAIENNYALSVSALNGKSALVTIPGITNTLGYGLYASSTGDNSETDILGCNLGVTAMWDAVIADAQQGGSTSVSDLGDVNGGTGLGIYAYADNTSQCAISARNVNVSGGMEAICAHAQNSSETSVSAYIVTGQVVAFCGPESEVDIGTKTIGYRQYADTDEMERYPAAVILSTMNDETSKTTFTCNGNIFSSNVGIMIDNFIWESEGVEDSANSVSFADQNTGIFGKQDILVDGTIDGKNGAIGIVGADTNTDNISITAYKIKPDNYNALVRRMVRGENGEGPLVLGEEDDEFEKRINYILRVDQPGLGATLTLTDENGKSLNVVKDLNDDTYQVAKEGDKVLVKVDLQKGFYINRITLGGDNNLLKDENGDYYFDVPRGGGVKVTAEVKDSIADSTEELVDQGLSDEEKGQYREKLADGSFSLANIYSAVLNSEEYLAQKLSASQTIERFYPAFLRRGCSPEENDAWTRAISLRRDNCAKSALAADGDELNADDLNWLLAAFMLSEEYKNLNEGNGLDIGGIYPDGSILTPELRTYIHRMYRNVLGREAEMDGFYGWADLIWNGEETAGDLPAHFFFSPEYLALEKADDAFVTDCYHAVLGREPEAEGYAYWLEKLAGGATREEVLRGFTESPEFLSQIDGLGRPEEQ